MNDSAIGPWVRVFVYRVVYASIELFWLAACLIWREHVKHRKYPTINNEIIWEMREPDRTRWRHRTGDDKFSWIGIDHIGLTSTNNNNNRLAIPESTE